MFPIRSEVKEYLNSYGDNIIETCALACIFAAIFSIASKEVLKKVKEVSPDMFRLVEKNEKMIETIITTFATLCAVAAYGIKSPDKPYYDGSYLNYHSSYPTRLPLCDDYSTYDLMMNLGNR